MVFKEKALDKATIDTYHEWIQEGVRGELNSISLGPGKLPFRLALGLIFFAVCNLLVGILLVALRMRHVYLWDWDSQFLGPFFFIMFLLCMSGATYLIILAKRRSHRYRSELYFRPVGDWGVSCVHKSELARADEFKHDLKSGTTPHKTIKPSSDAYSKSSKQARNREGQENKAYDRTPTDSKPFRPDHSRNGPPSDGRKGPPPDGKRGPPPHGGRRGPPVERRRGQPPEGHRGPPPDGRRGPPPDGRRGPPPDGRRGPPPEGHRGPPPDGRRGPPPDGRRGPPPDGRRGPPPDGRRGPPPDGYRGPPPDGYRGPPREGHRGPPPDGRRGPPPPGGRRSPPPHNRDSPSPSPRNKDSPPPSYNDFDRGVQIADKSRESESEI